MQQLVEKEKAKNALEAAKRRGEDVEGLQSDLARKSFSVRNAFTHTKEAPSDALSRHGTTLESSSNVPTFDKLASAYDNKISMDEFVMGMGLFRRSLLKNAKVCMCMCMRMCVCVCACHER
jgi:hypothetical protein